MYREANGWQSTFFAPHDSEGFIALYPSKKAFENKLDSLFMIPWDGYEAHNLTTLLDNIAMETSRGTVLYICIILWISRKKRRNF